MSVQSRDSLRNDEIEEEFGFSSNFKHSLTQIFYCQTLIPSKCVYGLLR